MIPDTVYEETLRSWGWLFVPTAPHEWEWRKFDAAGKLIAVQGDATWAADCAAVGRT